MSTETVSDQTTTEQNGHVASTPGMGGTSTAEEARADDPNAGEEGQEQEPEGAEPEGAERKGEEPARREDVEPSEADQRLMEADAIARTILADPARLREYQKWVKTDNGGGGGDDRLAGMQERISRRFPREADREAVMEFVVPMAEELRDLREEQRRMRPLVEQSSRTSAATELARSLEANGVSAETQRTPEFRKYLARERRDADTNRDLTRRPTYAGKNLARGWMATTGTRATRTAENRRTDDLKNGRLHNGAGPSRNGTAKVYVVDKTEPGWDAKLLTARLAAEERGEKFVRSFATPKK